MDNKEFDKYIKEFSKNELDTPDDLSWENLDIKTPPKKDSRDRKIFILLFFGLVSVALAYWLLQNETVTYTKNTRQTSDLTIIGNFENDNQKVDKNESLDSDQTNNSKYSYSESLSSDIIKSESNRKPIMNSNSKVIIASNQNNTEEIKQGNGNQATQQNKPLKEKSALISSDYNNNPQSKVNSSIDMVSRTVKNEITLPKGEDTINERIIKPTVNIEPLNYNNIEVDSNQNSIQNVPVRLIERKNEPMYSISLFSGISYDNDNFSEKENTNLNGYHLPHFGQFYKLELFRTFPKNWSINISAGFRERHTVFSYEQDLGTYENFDEFAVIQRTRIIYNNNKWKLITSGIGVGKNFSLTSKFSLHINAQAEYNRIVTTNGKYLDENSMIAEVSSDSVINKNNVTVGLRTFVTYGFKDDFRLQFGASYNQMLTSRQIILEEIPQMNYNNVNVLLGVGMKL